MIGAPNSLNLNCKVGVINEAPGPSVSEEIADIFTNFNIDVAPPVKHHRDCFTIEISRRIQVMLCSVENLF